ncbi:MAG: hypothetical protein O7D86_05595 [Proteobacteria bacterium]|nr:hypothetical protein [Pseudomonadota bacterium]
MMDLNQEINVMAIQMQKKINQRQQQRKFFSHKVQWMHQSDQGMESEALDMSPWGIFRTQ